MYKKWKAFFFADSQCSSKNNYSCSSLYTTSSCLSRLLFLYFYLSVYLQNFVDVLMLWVYKARSPARLLLGVIYEERWGDWHPNQFLPVVIYRKGLLTVCCCCWFFLSPLGFHCCYFAGKRKYNHVCDAPQFNLLFFGSCLLLFFIRSFI